jgi:hypothetical protein
VSVRPNPIGERSVGQDLDAGFGVGSARVAQAETPPNKSAFALGKPSRSASEMPAAHKPALRG